MDITIYHNPRCSKSRQTLALIEAAGVTPTIVKYLDQTLTVSDITSLLEKLGVSNPRDIMRRGEAVYRGLGLKTEKSSTVLVRAISENPILLERPIVVRGERAIMGRPPENVNELLR